MARSLQLTPLAVVTLGIFAELPAHPYQVYQLMLKRGLDKVVKLRPGTLYHTIGKLAENNLLEETGTEREGNRPERTIYRITEHGRLAFKDQIHRLLDEPNDPFTEFELGLAEAHNLASATVIELLTQRRDEQQKQLSALDERRKRVNDSGTPMAFWFVLDYRAAAIQAEIEWLTHFLTDLRAGTISWPLEDKNV